MLIEELAPGVVVVGTAHISATSVAEVERTIRERRPAKVLVELDPRRLAALQDPEAWRKTDIVQVVKEGKHCRHWPWRNCRCCLPATRCPRRSAAV